MERDRTRREMGDGREAAHVTGGRSVASSTTRSSPDSNSDGNDDIAALISRKP